MNAQKVACLGIMGFEINAAIPTILVSDSSLRPGFSALINGYVRTKWALNEMEPATKCFHFHVVYKKGTLDTLVDVLSRIRALEKTNVPTVEETPCFTMQGERQKAMRIYRGGRR